MKKIRLLVTGCMGRMGQQIIKSVKNDKNFKLTALTENRKINKKILSKSEKFLEWIKNGIRRNNSSYFFNSSFNFSIT